MMRNLILIFLVSVGLSGCLFDKPKPEIVVKTRYVKVKNPKPPVECLHDYTDLKKLPQEADINVLAGDSAVQRRGRLDDREIAKVCQSYVKKLARK